MDVFWSASTTMRNPERTLNFLKTVIEIEGDVWNDETQCKYQSLLIKNRFYTPTAKNLPDELYNLMQNPAHELTYDEAAEIFVHKKYVDAPMRGRTSFDPLEKLGLVSLDENDYGIKCVRITEFGRMFLNGIIDLGEVVFTSLLKTQFPNPLEDGRQNYNIKPFICTLRLIKRVNELCELYGIKAVGISMEEFGIFVLSLKSYLDIDDVAEHIIYFRKSKQSLLNDEEKIEFVDKYISDYLGNFQNPHSNIKEYADNIIRYLRLTKYICIRGGGYYIDLEPRRMLEIDAILKNDVGRALEFTKTEYKQYIGDYHAYILPFETVESLTEIAFGIIADCEDIATRLDFGITQKVEIPTTIYGLKQTIVELRERRAEYQNFQIRQEYKDIKRIDEAIEALSNLLNHNVRGANRPSIELERLANIALNILNDATLIKPNAPLGDDNEPTFTAPAGVPDIVCYYDDFGANGFGAICEVTMLTGRDQWYNEGQPVMRHLRAFEQKNNLYENYCLFIAPRLHVDTINTFWTAVKYEYEGKRQKIVPITIGNLIYILNTVRNLKESFKQFKKEDLRLLYDGCIDISTVSDSTKWQKHVVNTINDWATTLMSRTDNKRNKL